MKRLFSNSCTSLKGICLAAVPKRCSSSTTGSQTPHPSESFASGSNSVYLDQMYQLWESNPEAVHASWNAYFSNIRAGLKPGEACQVPPSIMPGAGLVAPSAAPAGGFDQKTISDHIKVFMLVRAHQLRGHHVCDLDPLGLQHADLDESKPASLELSYYGFTEADLDRTFHFNISHTKGFLSRPSWKLRDLINALRTTYCDKIGYEFMHIRNLDAINWLRDRIEAGAFTNSITKNDKLTIHEKLMKADLFEQFLAKKYPEQKRFGLDGCEALIPGMEALVDVAVDLGTESVVLGMAHRGRLNVLCNVVKKPLESLLCEFQHKAGQEYGSGDVKYHLGMSFTREASNGKPVTISLMANPSHLEAVDPVVLGKVRARQYYMGDTARDKVLGVLIHGDAAFAGQGVVYETMGLSDLHSYTTGGTIHIVVNNQIGFTTNPRQSRSSPYCSDIAKAFDAPVFHVNGDDPEAVIHVCKMAAEFRAKFKKDVVVDIICYRRYGHNEQDEPRFTQPLMYQKIATHPRTIDLYKEKLVKEGTLSDQDHETKKKSFNEIFETAFERSKTYIGKTSEWLSSKWKGFKSPAQMSRIQNTGVSMDILKQVGKSLYSYPKDFNLHPNLVKIMKAKEQMFETGEGIDFATAEALAFGTLLLEGNHVRLSGQDVERGTFSHRHAVLVDQKVKDKTYIPMNHIDPKQSIFTPCNSSLSEFGVLGFELGYSLESPYSLVLWEAQFGDFSNGAQVIIDQFLSSGETKWLRQSGIVLLLPHGYDGMGPEHSSARLERFLQMVDEDPDKIPVMDEENRKQIQENNWQVVNCTTAANYYHVLRRQVHRSFRKPLIIMTPKSILRPTPNANSGSKLSEMAEGTRFQRVIPETSTDLVQDDKVRKVIFCSGKVYYDLLRHRQKIACRDVAIVRVEQISPFPFDRVMQQLQKYPRAQAVWAQEEPKNMGAWTYVYFRFETAFKEIGRRDKIAYAGRPTSAAPATGFAHVHREELENLLEQAFH